jgi:phosphoserine aminotransferase
MRVFNFSAGPAALPPSVLEQAAAEMLDWNGSGMSVMEMSHRGPEFMGIHAEALTLLRELLDVPSNYRVLFMQGGGLGENAIVPLNLLGKNQRADFVITGSWSKKSFKEAQRYGQVRVAADAAKLDSAGRYLGVPPVSAWQRDSGAAYLHLCTNETIDGVEYFSTPESDGVPLVADASSHLLSRPMRLADFGLIFGGAQKNIGPAGLTIVIIRDDLLDQAQAVCPSAFEYKTVAEHDSMYNTPPTWGIYVAGLVFKWLKSQGGLTGIEAANIAKAKLLYDTIDASSLYENRVDPACRSRMNVPFFLKDETRNDAFLKGAKARGLLQLKGHRSVGGMRASIYNAMPLAGVQALTSWMREFEKEHA